MTQVWLFLHDGQRIRELKIRNIPCFVGQITGTGPVSPRRHEGRFAVVTKRGAGCDGRCGVRRVRSPDETPAAYGKVVWSWRRDRGVYPFRPVLVGQR